MPPCDRPEVSEIAAGEKVATAAVVDPGLVEAMRVDAEAKPRLLAGKVFPGRGEGGAVGGRVGFVTVMPLAEDAGAVAGVMKHLRNRGFGGREFTANFRPRADANRMPPRQQHRPRRGTDAPAHAGGEFDALGEEGVDRRCRHPSAMAGEIAPADVIGQNGEHVGWAAIFSGSGRRGEADAPREGCHGPGGQPRGRQHGSSCLRHARRSHGQNDKRATRVAYWTFPGGFLRFARKCIGKGVPVAFPMPVVTARYSEVPGNARRDSVP